MSEGGGDRGVPRSPGAERSDLWVLAEEKGESGHTCKEVELKRLD